ncbi:hypothetical protein [Celeribacter marinus]|uniref:Uncharacterized protein n=1 Tax=Celeribacter marinus TaxID=1397108 RepID=A0A0P0AE24_9RHOB|nr:hypothetical protein [Celeribacter marinus]ALI56759.1 hypothetical protein IMCC12053_2812 [Celeribacter marinus]SFL00709.1 hypothetical protein SAMN05444421_112143 [Celeribacter marinus]
MLLEFIAVIALGGGTAGIVMLIQKLTRGALPRWSTSAAAGLAMLGFAIWSEYSWLDRTAAALGPDHVVVTSVERKQIWRPWTYLVPVTTRFITVDMGKTQIKDRIVATDLYLLSRWQKGAVVPVAFDCQLGRRADIFAGFSDDLAADLIGANWITLEENDPIFTQACTALN